MTRHAGSRFLLCACVAVMGMAWGARAPRAATPCVPIANLSTPGTLTMATNPSLPPLQYVSVDGKLHGMRIELGHEIASRLCLKAHIIPSSFAALILGLMEQRWDMIDTGMFYTHERSQMMELIPYEQQAISITLRANMDKPVHAIEDLAGMSVGVEMGGFEEQRARQIDRTLHARGLAGLQIHAFDNFAIAFVALRAGQVDAVVSIDVVAHRFADDATLRIGLMHLFPTPVALAVRDRQLALRIAQVMNDMREDGSLNRLFQAHDVIALPGPITVYGPETGDANP
ncbi:amino acid ABC transporter [Komagataeibacter xylinus]|uniref:Amino acid ABC transporter n=1 Tax=Komagataeibacter xylinus TaxID=28448 RepID=A0A318PIM4_KOMXY|nr:transporter substrate-binding domain-containing protein [Komagataeibacter xylinus]PYD56732.1 amino acid ABC transporter [Komagataeibacter xylinus]GBQ74065.1 extracellular solute-binding protein family 3 [Komagataeibacter xylinus NBRC 15237]